MNWRTAVTLYGDMIAGYEWSLLGASRRQCTQNRDAQNWNDLVVVVAFRAVQRERERERERESCKLQKSMNDTRQEESRANRSSFELFCDKRAIACSLQLAYLPYLSNRVQ